MRWLKGNPLSRFLATTVGCSVVASFLLASSSLAAKPTGVADNHNANARQSRQVDLRLPGGQRIRAIHDSPSKPVPTRQLWHARRPVEQRKQVRAADMSAIPMLDDGQSLAAPTVTVSTLTINSPPIDGFVPYIAVQTTNAKKWDEWNATASTSVVGSYTAPNPTTNYGIGLLDTGAGISVLGNANSSRFGLLTFPTYNTSKTVTIEGVTGSVDAWVSQPIGLWMAGLGAINPSTGALDTSKLVGEWNVSVAMGPTPAPAAPDLATAIGSPMAVYYATSIRNDQMLSIQREGQTYDAPSIQFYSRLSPAIPVYPNSMPLELRPTGGSDVMYWPCFSILEDCPGGDGTPSLPSLILGFSAQSLFFASSVNLGDNGHQAMNQYRFIIDTGAQVTVIGSRIAAMLGVNPTNPDFTVEIQGLDGQIVDMPGFYLDTLDLPALGQWLSYTNVPVVLLDVASPEGGVLDGIIGMNLFNRYNLVLRGGGMVGMSEPWLDFEPILNVDADFDDDGDVDMEDFGVLQGCLSGQGIAQNAPECQVAKLNADNSVDAGDLELFIACKSGPGIPAAPECLGQ